MKWVESSLVIGFVLMLLIQMQGDLGQKFVLGVFAIYGGIKLYDAYNEIHKR